MDLRVDREEPARAPLRRGEVTNREAMMSGLLED